VTVPENDARLKKPKEDFYQSEEEVSPGVFLMASR